MNVIATLRSLVAAPRRGLTGVLLIAVVIAGVVSMHSMSGSPSAHLPPPGMVAAHDGAGDCDSGCGSHDMTTAMCLMVLVALLTLAAPPVSFLNAMLLPLARRVLVAEPHSRPAAAPSLHALGISRT